MSVILPHQQRSWIGKAHIVGASVVPTYFRPGTLHEDDGTVHALPRGSDPATDDSEGDGDEWVLINSTPASCVQVGLYHYFQDRGPVDLVVSGPNYGRNTTALFALSSGTIGGAMEASVCGKRSIALSYAFSSRTHDPVVIAEASSHSVKLIEYLCANWGEQVDLYSVNVPLEPEVSQWKVAYTEMLDNRWTSGSCFKAVESTLADQNPGNQEQRLREQGEKSGSEPAVPGSAPPGKKPQIQHMHFQWSPNFTDVFRSVEESAPGNDGRAIRDKMTRFVFLARSLFGVDGFWSLTDIQIVLRL